MEPVIDEQVLGWLRRVDRDWASQAGEPKMFDIGRRIQYLTVDIITKVCLGEELGDVVSDSDKFDFLATVEQGNSVCQHMSVLLELNTLMYYFTKIPYIGLLIVAKPTDQSGVGKIMGVSEAGTAVIVESWPDSCCTDRPTQPRCPRQIRQHKSERLVGFSPAKGPTTLSDRRRDSHLFVSVQYLCSFYQLTGSRVAGSDTTSTSIQSTLLAIILNPRIYQKLKIEIEKAITEGVVSYPIQETEARQLPYLQACILEGLRKHPPLSQLRERIVPPGGDTIEGRHIPGGTYIGLNAWGTQLDDIFGDDTDTFRPERWLIDDQERLKAMHKTHELIFGYGSTKCLGVSMAMMELYKMIFEVWLMTKSCKFLGILVG